MNVHLLYLIFKILIRSSIYRDHLKWGKDHLISGNIEIEQIKMQTLLTENNPQQRPIAYDDADFDEAEGEELFNQVQLDQLPLPMAQQQQHGGNDRLELYNGVKLEKLTKLNKRRQMDSDQDQNADVNVRPLEQEALHHRSDKKKRKEQKKLRKKLKKQKKKLKLKEKKQKGFKRLRKEGEERDDGQKASEQWSGQSSDQMDEDSDASSDSLLKRLHPTKKNASQRKQNKQGFSLKELGNNPEIQYKENQNMSQDSDYKGKERIGKSKKTKAQKKDVVTNQQLLKTLLNIGLCVDQQNQQDKKEGYEYDNGLDQMNNMRGSKKKGLKITNKLFTDMELGDHEENHQPIPKQIELQVKPRTHSGSSVITHSFLNKAEKLKKARGMESDLQNQDYEKMISLKKRESMSKLINQKEVKDAEEIQLDVKVPELIRGGSELNNSIFLRRISSTLTNRNSQKEAPSPKKEIKKTQNQKISRLDFFKSISQQAKARRSKQISNQIISKSFKVTKLEEIEELRKKNQQKRKREALMGSDEQNQEEQDEDFNPNANDNDPIRQNKLGFLNSRIDGNTEEKIQEQKAKQNKEEPQVPKQKEFTVNVQKSILPQEQYRKLLSLEQQESEMQNEEQQSVQKQQVQQQLEQQQDQNEYPELQEPEEQPFRMQQQNLEDKQDIVDEEYLDSAEKVQLEVDLQVSSPEESHQNMESEDNQQVNEEYQQYLNQLEAEGIEIKKQVKNKNKTHSSLQNNQQEQQQVQMGQHINKISESPQKDNIGQQNQARKQFRKLRKLATIIKNKKKAEERVKMAGQFYEQEAEEGSDNEEHDHEVKKINDDDQQKQYQGLDLDAELQELIDNAVDINEEDQELAFRKYMEDVKIKDREELKRIMRGDFSRNREQEHLIDEIDEDQKKRIERMEKFEQYLKQKQLEDGKEMYMVEKENENQNKSDDNSSEKGSNQAAENDKDQNEDMQIQIVDEMNEENLKRYLDEGVAETYITKKIVKRPISQLPESYQRSKKTQMRNTMKAKEIDPEVFKLKKTSSHLNEMIMKNKQKFKPLTLPFLKSNGIILRK